MTTTENPSVYDLEEARELVARKNDVLNPDTAARINASEDLLRALVSLGGTTGVGLTEDKFGKGYWVYSGDDVVQVQVGQRGVIYAGMKNGIGNPIPGLEFNPIEKRWEGTEPDTFRPSGPGEPPKRRSGAAVVIEHVMSLGDSIRGQARLNEEVSSAGVR